MNMMITPSNTTNDIDPMCDCVTIDNNIIALDLHGCMRWSSGIQKWMHVTMRCNGNSFIIDRYNWLFVIPVLAIMIKYKMIEVYVVAIVVFWGTREYILWHVYIYQYWVLSTMSCWVGSLEARASNVHSVGLIFQCSIPHKDTWEYWNMRSLLWMSWAS